MHWRRREAMELLDSKLSSGKHHDDGCDDDTGSLFWFTYSWSCHISYNTQDDMMVNITLQIPKK